MRQVRSDAAGVQDVPHGMRQISSPTGGQMGCSVVLSPRLSVSSPDGTTSGVNSPKQMAQISPRSTLPGLTFLISLVTTFKLLLLPSSRHAKATVTLPIGSGALGPITLPCTFARTTTLPPTHKSRV